MSAFDADKVHGIFADTRKGLDDIKADGWAVRGSSSGSWWWEKLDPETRKLLDRQYLPWWVSQLLQREYERGRREVQEQMHIALGLKKPPKLKVCAPGSTERKSRKKSK